VIGRGARSSWSSWQAGGAAGLEDHPGH
jgi:hypothetical protein